MSACGRFEDRMVEALYGELGEAPLREFEGHVDACPRCAALYGELRATVAAMNERRRPDPGAEFWNGYWQRLEARVARDEAVVDASRFGWRRSIGSWGYRAAAAVIVLAAGVWLGRAVFAPAPRTMDRAPEIADATPRDDGRGQTQEPAPRSDGTRVEETGGPAVVATRPEAIDAPAGEPRETTRDGAAEAPATMVAAGGDDALRYIGRSQVVLLALLNAGDGEAVPASYTSEREQARVLVAEGRRLQEGLTRPQDRRLRELVGQLEMILREIANLEADTDLEAVEMIRNRVDREGVLLQIDLRQMREASAPGGRAAGAGNAIDQQQ